MLNVKSITVSKMASHRACTVQMREESEADTKVRRDVI